MELVSFLLWFTSKQTKTAMVKHVGMLATCTMPIFPHLKSSWGVVSVTAQLKEASNSRVAIYDEAITLIF